MSMGSKILIASVVVAFVACWLSLPKQPDPEISIVVPELRLVDFGHIQPALSAECKEYAFGCDWSQLSAKQAVERWNEKHGDLFLIEMTDSVERTNRRIYEAWKEHENRRKL